MFNLHTCYTFTMPQGTISESGIRLIKTFLDSQRLSSDDWKALNPNCYKSYLPDLSDDWQWTWVLTGKGEYVGTFPKRLAKFFFQEHGIKCPTSFLQEIGNIARQHSSEQITFTFDFTNLIDWEDGDFGDSNSCFWGSRSAARGMLEQNNALAIRFYAGDSGIGRAWVAQLSNSRYIVFNGYGIQGNATLKIAQIMATWLGLNYKKIALCNHGETSSTLWINSDLGYLIGTPEQTAAMDKHDLEFDCDDCYTCDNCGDSLDEDDSYSTPNGESYCRDCFYNHYGYCAHCDDAYSQDYLYYIESVGDVCEHCLDRHYTRCDKCEEHFPNDEITRIEDNFYCENCKPEESENETE